MWLNQLQEQWKSNLPNDWDKKVSLVFFKVTNESIEGLGYINERYKLKKLLESWMWLSCFQREVEVYLCHRVLSLQRILQGFLGQPHCTAVPQSKPGILECHIFVSQWLWKYHNEFTIKGKCLFFLCLEFLFTGALSSGFQYQPARNISRLTWHELFRCGTPALGRWVFPVVSMEFVFAELWISHGSGQIQVKNWPDKITIMRCSCLRELLALV